MLLKLLGSTAAASALLFSAPATAALTTFTADLQTLNPDVDPGPPDADPSGSAELVYNDQSNTLQVRIEMSGLTPGQFHAQHIHGLINPTEDSMTPTAAADTDGDGFIELAEGAPVYGPILLPLTRPNGQFLTADQNGNLTYTRVFNLDQVSYPDGVDQDDLFPLTLREIVIHGAFLPEGAGGNGGEADGTAGYKAFLPVAAGEIQTVPVPGAALLFGGVGLMAGAYRRFTGKR